MREQTLSFPPVITTHTFPSPPPPPRRTLATHGWPPTPPPSCWRAWETRTGRSGTQLCWLSSARITKVHCEYQGLPNLITEESRFPNPGKERGKFYTYSVYIRNNCFQLSTLACLISLSRHLNLGSLVGNINFVLTLSESEITVSGGIPLISLLRHP